MAGGAGGAGVPATAGDATWIHRFFSGTLWSTPGGDFAAVSSAQTVVGGPGLYQWSAAGMLADVQAWYLAPGANFGWILVGDESVASSAKRFATREDLVAGNRPSLTITFIPAPSAAALGGLALAGMATRRRRA